MYDALIEEIRVQTLSTIKGVSLAIADAITQISYTAALLGGGVLIVLHVAGMQRAQRYFGILQVAHILIQGLLEPIL